MSEKYTISDYAADLRKISRETTSEDEIISRVGPLARRLATDKTWLEDKHFQGNPEQGFAVHLLHEEPNHSLAVFAVNWLPGCGAPPHDHGTWAVVAGVDGFEKNVSYKRIDDRTRPNYAELEIKKETIAGPGDLVCMKSGGIHSVQNESDSISLSLHTYGRHVNFTERSQFDPETREKKDFKVSIE